MKREYIDIADEIIKTSLDNGYSEPTFDVWKEPKISNILKLYGRTDALGRYYLNSDGMRYALQGCSKGISEQLDIEKRIQTLELKTKSFSAEKQGISFWVSIFSAIISTIMAIITFLL